eukprot:GHVR01060299.1.p1 GENE.GHVR01060299.1~~GHVR01060299.1.p1  ORF type:complete len:160 (+),score=48.53 GHVR01060299.1:184-663(+)
MGHYAPMCVSDLTHTHTQSILRLCEYCNWICSRLSRDTHTHTSTHTQFKCGVHSVPSLNLLHVHIISKDFNSVHVKSARVFLRFLSDFFIPLDKLASIIGDSTTCHRTSNAKLLSFDPKDKKQLLLGDLYCNKCGVCFERKFKSLKAHLQSCNHTHTHS